MVEKKKKKPERYLRKVIQPLMFHCIESFKAEFNGKYLAEVSQFKDFKEKLSDFFEVKKNSKVTTPVKLI